MSCPACPEITLAQLGDEFLAQVRERRYPLSGSLELTERCNLTCVHCFVNQPAASREAAAREMTLPEVRRVLDQIAGAGCLYLLMTGGEALLRPDFRDIYRHAKQRGLLVTLFTNGTLLTPRTADFLAEWRPALVEITLYGATQATYERVTGVPGSHARCVRGIELLLERGLRLNLKSFVLRANHHELAAMRALAEGLGVQYRFDAVLFPRLDGDQAVLAQRLSAAEVVALDMAFPERRAEVERLNRQFGALPVRNDYVYSCGAGTGSFHVDSAGRLSLCMMARRASYDLLHGSFQQGWEELGAVLDKKRTLDTACRTCKVGPLCTQCPGWSQLMHGDDETPVAYVCEMGHLRAAQTVSAVETGPGA